MSDQSSSNQAKVQEKLQALKKQYQNNNSHSAKTPAYYQLRKELHAELLNEISPEDLMNDANHQKIKQQIIQIVNTLMQTRGLPLGPEQKITLLNELSDEVLGFGPLEPLLRDPEITEIMINGPKITFVEKAGKIVQLSDLLFQDADHLLHIVKRIALRIGRTVDQGSPTVDARLPDGSRVHAIIPPLALDGCTVTIRKFPEQALTVDKLVGFNALTENMAKFLHICVQGRLNTIIAGGTGSGKTTLLNALSSYIQNSDRIITVEDSAELQLQQDHVVRLETRVANAEGVGEVTARELIKNSLRMRPNRIIVGECRSGEALDMLQAMNTGHEGSMTTVHANTSRDTMKRIETLVLMSGVDLPLRTVREMIAGTIDIICLQGRMQDGSRKIKQISEVVGMEGDTITLQDIFIFRQTGLDKNGKVTGYFQPTGVLPRCIQQLKSHGIDVPMNIFAPNNQQPEANPKKQGGFLK